MYIQYKLIFFLHLSAVGFVVFCIPVLCVYLMYCMYVELYNAAVAISVVVGFLGDRHTESKHWQL